MSSIEPAICLVQIGEVGWERRAPRTFRLGGGGLRSVRNRSGPSEGSLSYFPHSAALLQGYARRFARGADRLKFLPPLFSRRPLNETVDYLVAADVVGFSTYVWNIRYSLAVARELKRRRPDVLIVLGGPQVPDRCEEFLRDHPFVDVVCHGEGERTFCEVLDHRGQRTWYGVQSTSFIAADGTFVANPRRPRMRDLDEIPSPMLDGVYGDLMAANPGQQWLATWETNRGCPFSCAFCDWGSATAAKVSRYGLDRLHQEIDWMADHEIEHLFVCDANFGMLGRDVGIARHLAEAYSRRGRSVAISIQNTKNRTDRSEQIQRVFKESGVVSFGASISLQSVDPGTLAAIRRENISLESFENLQRKYAQQGLDTYTDLVIGLPGETYDSFADGIRRVIYNGQLNRVVFYECSVLPNAPMARPEYRAQFGLETVPTRIISAHEPLDRDHAGSEEFIDIVVATGSMDRADWIRTRTFAYAVDLLFYDRLLHVPLALLSAGWGVDVREVVEAFVDAEPAEFPVVASVMRGLQQQARSVAAGHPQYIPSAEWLNLWWPTDQHALIALVHGGRLDAFYREAVTILHRTAGSGGGRVPTELVDDAVRLNQRMLALPFQLVDEVVETVYPVGEDYFAVLAGRPPSAQRSPRAYRVRKSAAMWLSWDDWYSDMVLRANLRRRHLHEIVPGPRPRATSNLGTTGAVSR